MKFDVDVSGYERFLKDLNRIENDYENITREVVLEFAGRVLSTLKDPDGLTPVDTGRLRDSFFITEITKQGDEYFVYIKNDAKNDNGDYYAEYVEYGHMSLNNNWVSGHFMLSISAFEVEKQIQKIIDRKVKKAWEKWNS